MTMNAHRPKVLQHHPRSGSYREGGWRLREIVLILAELLQTAGCIHYVVAVIVLFSSVQASSQEVQLPKNPLAGEKLFTGKGCVNCHSIMGQGGSIGSDLGKSQAGRSPVGIVSMMWNHASDMTRMMQKSFEMPKFTGEEMGSMIAFLYFLNYFDDPGDADNGEILVSAKRCIKCHSIRGEGGKVGPPLDRMKQYASPIFLAQAMWNHGSGMSGTMKALSVERPVLEGRDIADLMAFIQNISQANVKEQTYMVPGDPKIGEKLFVLKQCSKCHKIGDRGGSIGPDLTKKELNVGAAAIAAKMWNHGSKMFAKMKELHIEQPKFQGSEMADVIAYLYFLGFVSHSGNVEQGKKIFSEKKCSECHKIRGEGGNVGPDLAKSKNVSNFINAAAAMWNHGYNMRLLMQKVNIPIPRFTAEEMNDLLAYIRSQRLGQE
jgi:mono/diheme cytochrome c family protein